MSDCLFWPPINLAQPRLGARVVYASDEFFAAKERLIDPAEPVFRPGVFDANGKWMDGWESRRRRRPGHEYCILRLGTRAIVESVDIDTRHFTGNFPPAASLDLCIDDAEIPSAETVWRQAVPVTALTGDSCRTLPLPAPLEASHLRLNIYPDGGVARLRVFGRILLDADRSAADPIDLAAMVNGGAPIACNDAHFGGPDNLIAPGRGADMGDGWETRRRREPGHDWAILSLCCPGRIEQAIVDTAHFKGNYPDRVSLQAAYAPGMPRELLVTQSMFWPVLLPETPMSPDAEHVLEGDLADLGPVSHVKVNLHPDGGLSRLRLPGRPHPHT